MAVIDITVSNIKEIIDGNDIVLVDFWAEWCAPCRAFAPVFEQASEDHPDIVFGKCDVSQEAALAVAFRIAAIPTLMAFRGGVLVSSQSGMLPAPALESLIAEIRGS